MTRVMLISLIAAAVVGDQLTKTAALSLLSQGTAVPVLPGFNLSLGFNTGASFGMMGGFMAGKPLLMAALTGALTFAFDAVSAGTLAEGAEVIIERGAAKAFCVPCGLTIEVATHADVCPHCGVHQWMLTEGDEMRVTELEVE